MNHDRSSYRLWRWVLGGLLCFAGAQVARAGTATGELSSSYAAGGRIKFVATWGPPDESGLVLVSVVATGTSNPTGNPYSPGLSGTVSVADLPTLYLPRGGNSAGVLNQTVTKRVGAGGVLSIGLYLEEGQYDTKNVTITRDIGQWRSSPQTFTNPYDVPMKLGFVQNGQTVGNVTVGPGQTWIGQVDSNSAADIKAVGTLPGYQFNSDGSLSPGGPEGSGASWVAGTFPAGEAVNYGGSPVVSGSTPATGPRGGMTPTTGQVGWSGSAASGTSGLDAGTYRQGVEAIVAAVKSGSGTGSGSTGTPGEPIDPRPNIDQFREAVQDRWKAEDEETKKRRAFGDAMADRYTEAKTFSAGSEIANASAQYQVGAAPAGWAPKAVSATDPGSGPTLSLPGPKGEAITLNTSAASMPGGLSGVASWGKSLLLLAAGVWLVRGCLSDMRAYLVGLGAVAPAGAGVLVGMESVAPGVPQAKAVGLALAATAVMATAWAGLAAFLSSGVLGEAVGRMTGFSVNGGLGILSEWIPFAGLVAIWVGRATFDLVAAPVYLAACGALKFMSV